MNVLTLGVLFAVGQNAWTGLRDVNDAAIRLLQVSSATRGFQGADTMHDAIRGDVLDTMLSGPEHTGTALQRHAAQMLDELDRAREAWSESGRTEPFPDVDELVHSYIADAEHIVAVAQTDPEGARALLPSFLDRYIWAERRFTLILDTVLMPAQTDAATEASEARQKAERAIVGVGLSSSLVVSAFVVLFGRFFLQRLRRLGRVAGEMASGRLETRATDDRDDEVGHLAESFNAMADALAAMLRRHEADAERTTFSTQLASALDLADTHYEATTALERALQVIAPKAPSELLLSDSSQAHLERAAANPEAGPAGCAVESPWSCVAVRRAQLLVTSDSEALDACPRLRNRPAGPCSAVCVPVSFMGRAMGVIHMTGAPGQTPNPVVVDRLAVLAGQAGARMGTIRVMEKTQLQATTDGLTGLNNRRTVEDRVHQLIVGRRRYSLAIADLDFFKKLNDTFGHDAGDRALRRFAQILRDTARGGDIVGRFGGEEFILVLPETPVEGAANVLERIRAALHDPRGHGTGPQFTASFGLVSVDASETFEDALKRADVALYRAKEQGRDRVVVGDAANQVVRVAEPPYGLTG